MISEACSLCPALCVSRSQIVQSDPVWGGLLVIGEAPGFDEDREGFGFMGRSGKLLHSLLGQQGLVRGRDYGCANIVRCRPPDNRKPTSDEIWDCLPYLAETIRESQPSVILCVGLSASNVFLGGGNLLRLIQKAELHRSQGDPRLHPGLFVVADHLAKIKIISMPHTSPLAWNRKAPDGREWSGIGRRQVEIAARALREKRDSRGGNGGRNTERVLLAGNPLP